MPTPMSNEYKITERETESASNIDALYNICCVPFMKYSGIHTEKGRYVVCHDPGAPHFTVYMLSRGTDHEHKATGLKEREKGGEGASKILS